MQKRIVVRVVSGYLVIGFFLSTTLVYSYPLVPDPEITQGDLCAKNDPDFEKYAYQERIPYCQRNVNWSRREKIYDEYQIPSKCRHRYTIDHFIPLSLGGSNADTNLWPEHVLVKATRPLLEQELYFAIEQGEINQKEAIGIIVREKTKEKQRDMSQSPALELDHTKVKDECD